MKKAIVMCFYFSLVCLSLAEESSSKRMAFLNIQNDLSVQQVTISKLKTWLENAGYTTTIDKDGDLEYKDKSGKGSSFVMLDKKRSFVNFRSYWRRGDMSVEELRKRANKINNEFIFIKISVEEKGASLAYDLIYTGGLNRTNFIDSFKWFLDMNDLFEHYE